MHLNTALNSLGFLKKQVKNNPKIKSQTLTSDTIRETCQLNARKLAFKNQK